jgi:hypothetical protein
LTLPEVSSKCNTQVSWLSSNVYADWRLRGGVVPVLQEHPLTPPEHLLQAVWFHQRLRREELTTTRGQRVRILHPGFWNHEAGPDFRQAVVQFDEEPPRSGDVEVDLHSGNWIAHRHHANPAFRGVALHVVWQAEGRVRLPTLALADCLDAPLGELALWLGTEASRDFPAALRGRCAEPLHGLSEAWLGELLRQAAIVRLHSKAAQFKARARAAGWEQALWEGLFRALGYKQNVWPMLRLAELRSRICPDPSAHSPLVLQARLLGLGGLLPAELPRGRSGAAGYVRQLWDVWWRERDAYADGALPAELWKFSGLRPANHPQRRLALAAHWLAAGDLPARLERWCAAAGGEAELASSLHARLTAGPDPFWSWHWTLRSPRLPKAQPLLGAMRTSDLAVNAILPWLWARATEGHHSDLQQEIERRYLNWPAAEDNAVLRLARQRLLGSRRPRAAGRGAAAQQGLLQVVRDFCEHANALCADCRFPELLRQNPEQPEPGAAAARPDKS